MFWMKKKKGRKAESHTWTRLVLSKRSYFKAIFPMDITDFRWKTSQACVPTIVFVANLRAVHFAPRKYESGFERLILS
jgi:hypothetical protein